MAVAEPSTIRFVGDLVYKWYSSDVAGEYDKAHALWEVSQDSGFLCPEPVGFIEDESVVIYQNLRSHGDWVSVRSAYLDCMTGSAIDEAGEQAIAEAGRVLGAIHANLHLESAEPWSPTGSFRSSLERVGIGRPATLWEDESPVCLHGDFGFSNVLWSKDTGMLATLDASPDGYSTFAAGLLGPPYVDLGQFISCLEGRVPLFWYPRMKWDRLDRLRDTFVLAYEKEAGVAVDRETVRRFGFAIAEANFEDRLSFTIARRMASRTLFNKLKGNLL
jgi:hypothetical protein